MESSVREEIERRAYELFMARGGQHGYHIEDWDRAEKEVMNEVDNKSRKAPAPSEVSINLPVQTIPEEHVEQLEAEIETEKSVKPKNTRETSTEPGTVAKKRVVKKKAV